MIGGPVSRDLDARIHAAIEAFPHHVLDVNPAPASPPLAIKYIPARYGAAYHRPGRKLVISNTPGFTWGQATYVTTLMYPLSTAIFGRVGVISEFDPAGWRTFDATKEENKRLYLSWLQTRPKYRDFVLTAQSAWFGQQLRNLFRQNYRIDCVLFRPDQSNPRYTDVKSDVWMAVTDWAPKGKLASSYSGRFLQPRLTVIVEEEFEDRKGGTHREGVLRLATSTPAGVLPGRFRNAYYAGDIVRIPS